jgi:FkbM family methyltransferase
MMLSRSELERRLAKIMPPLLYCSLEERARSLLNRERRGGPKRRTGIDEIGLFVEWPQSGERFYLTHAFAHNSVVWPDGVARERKRLLEKYQDRDVTLDAGDILVEAGANVGGFTTAAAQIVRAVYSFEPDPDTFARLTRNAAKHRNVGLFKAGLGNVDGELPFYPSHANADSSFLEPRDKDDQCIRVPVTTLSTFMEKEGLVSIDFLKVEAEGTEPEILEGAGDRLRHVSEVAVDCGPERYGKDTYAECEAILCRARFRTWRRRHDWMLFGVQT